MSNTQIEPSVAVGYVRVSTDRQAEAGVSLEAQAEKIRAMAVVHGTSLLDVIIDAGESAKSLQRPGMARLMAMVEARQVQIVICAKLDRLTRSVKDLGELLERFQKRGVALVSVAESLDTASAAGRLVLNIMACVSQWEREAIGERTKAALGYKKSQLRAYSPTPFGFDRNGERLVENISETSTLQLIRERRNDGWSLHQIADALNTDGAPTKNGGKWYARTVKNLIDNTLHTSKQNTAI